MAVHQAVLDSNLSVLKKTYSPGAKPGLLLIYLDYGQKNTHCAYLITGGFGPYAASDQRHSRASAPGSHRLGGRGGLCRDSGLASRSDAGLYRGSSALAPAVVECARAG